jgi:hypothetical protein
MHVWHHSLAAAACMPSAPPMYFPAGRVGNCEGVTPVTLRALQVTCVTKCVPLCGYNFGQPDSWWPSCKSLSQLCGWRHHTLNMEHELESAAEHYLSCCCCCTAGSAPLLLLLLQKQQCLSLTLVVSGCCCCCCRSDRHALLGQPPLTHPLLVTP